MTVCSKPIPLDDELVDSYLVRIERDTGCAAPGLSTLEKERRFRICPNIGVGRWPVVWGSLCSMDLDDDSWRRLFMAGLLEPNAKWVKGRAWCHVPRINRNELKAQLAHCVLCTEKGISDYGYSYWRRQHQVRCNIYCPEHGFTIVDRCHSCGTQFSNELLPEAYCGLCGAYLLDGYPARSFRHSEEEIFRKIALAVRFLLSDVPRGYFNHDLIAAAINEQVACRVPGYFNNVARHLCNEIDPRRISEIELDPRRRPHFAWPAIFMNRRWPVVSPTFELVLFGLFGDMKAMRDCWSGERVPEVATFQRLPQGLQLDIETLRKVYHAKRWDLRDPLLGLPSTQLRLLDKPYPGFKERVKNFHQRVKEYRVRKKANRIA